MQQERTQLVVKSTLSCESLFKIKEWCVCAVSLEDETSKALLVKIIELWLTIRGSFFPLLGLMSNNYYCVSHCTCIIIIVNQDCCYTLLLTVFFLHAWPFGRGVSSTVISFVLRPHLQFPLTAYYNSNRALHSQGLSAILKTANSWIVRIATSDPLFAKKTFWGILA